MRKSRISWSSWTSVVQKKSCSGEDETVKLNRTDLFVGSLVSIAER